MTITITTSNVNGIRAAKRKGIEDWAGKHAPDVWCIQEVRAPQDDVDSIFDEFGFEYATAGKIEAPANLHAMNEVCRVKGRAGVGLLTDLEVLDKRYGLPGLSEDVDSGRWIETDVKTPEGYAITVASVYVHAGNTDDPTKMEQKYRFLDTMLKRMGALRDEAAHGGKQAVLCGDFNIAHTPLDIKIAKANEKHAGFLPEERAYVDKWLDEYEFVDVMRSLARRHSGAIHLVEPARARFRQQCRLENRLPVRHARVGGDRTRNSSSTRLPRMTNAGPITPHSRSHTRYDVFRGTTSENRRFSRAVPHPTA